MSPHASPTGPEPETARRAVAVVALVLAVTLAIGFASGVASATDTLERDGSNLVVNVSEVDDPDTVIVEVIDPAEPEITYSANATGLEGETVRIDVTDPDGTAVGGTDLRNATVTIRVEQTGENATDVEIANGTEVPLHAIAFADDRPAWSDTVGEGDDATDRLYVPLDADGTVGVPERTDVGLDLNGNGTADVQGTVRGNGSQLVVDRRDTIDAADDSREVLNLRVLSSAGPVIDDPSIEPELRSKGSGLALWHPLFDPDATYAVDASSVGEDARYVDTAAVTDRGYIALSELPAGETAVRVSASDETTLVNRTDADPLGYLGPPEIEATVAGDGTLRLGQSLAGLAVDGALVGTDDGSTYADVDTVVGDDGRVSLNAVGVANAETLLLSTAAGDVAVSLEAEGGDDAADPRALGGVLPVLLVFLGPLVVGLGLGGIVTRFQDGPPDTVSTVALGAVGFALAAGALLLIHYLPPVTVFGSTLQWVGLTGVAIGAVGTPAIPTVAASRTSGAAATSGPFAAKVTVTDGSSLFRGGVAVHYREVGGQDRYDPVTVRDGRKKIQMPGSGTWEVYARRGSARSNVATVDASDPSVTLTVPVEATLTVVDAVDGEPVQDATITGDSGLSGTTDRNGAVTLDPPEGEADAEIEVSHDRYVDARERVHFQQNATPTVTLDRRTGRLRGSIQVDSAAVGAVPIRIVPDDGFLADRFAVETVTTDDDGTIGEREVPIGKYRVEATLADQDGAYNGTETAVTVNESGTALAAIDARFTWRLDAARRDRINRIRSDVRSLSEGGGRDGTIPRYYASVVESMLDAAESVPDSGHEFVGREIDPGEAVDSILSAADRATDAVSAAMTTKRNVDLFAACADMPDANLRWSESFELAELLDRLEADSGAQRREVKQRYEAVDGLIEDRRGELSEIAPAREMQQRAWELTRETDRGPEAVAIGYTSLLLLDAVEELFEHDALRERLTRTVF